MRPNSFLRRVLANIVMLTMLFAAFAPSISTARAASGAGEGWVEICSVSGTKLVKAGEAVPGQPSVPVKAGAHGDHCSLCSSHAGSLALIAFAGVAIPVPPASRVAPTDFDQSFHSSIIWATPQSRAPPVFA